VNSFILGRHRPGVSPEVVGLIIGQDTYRLVVPDSWSLVDIAARYSWPELLPGALVDEDAELMEEHMADPDHKLTAGKLHVIVQSLGLYLYGWPFFTASRALATLAVNETVFGLWAMNNLPRDPNTFSAAEWVNAAVTWELAAAGHKEEDRNTRWGELTIPGRLPMHDRGVAPGWMTG